MCVPTTGEGTEMRDCSEMGTPRCRQGLGNTDTGDAKCVYRREEYRWEDENRA